MAGMYVEKFCKICGDGVVAKGLCGKHYLKLRRHGDPEFTARPHDWGTKHHLYLRRQDVEKSIYETLYKNQLGKCAICKMPETYKQNGRVIRLSIDHCHDTGAIRGLLCSTCNRGIGLLKDDPSVLKSAIKYLEEHNASISIKDNENIQLGVVKQCSVEWCDRLHDSNGLCTKHAKQLRAGVDPYKKIICKVCNTHIKTARPDTLFCSVSCKMKFHRKQGCYSAAEQIENPKCNVDGCDRPRHAQGICRKHYMVKWHLENPRTTPPR